MRRGDEITPAKLGQSGPQYLDLTWYTGLIYARLHEEPVAVKIIGTSHIAPESLKKVEQVILEEKPNIVAIELDRQRLFALLSKEKRSPKLRDIKRIGFKGWIFALLGGWVERRLGAKVGVAPGAEMIKAIETANKTGAKIALIDQDIEITLRRFSKALTWKEKFTFAGDLLKGIFLRKGITFDLAKVPPKKIIATLIEDVKKRYPNIYRVLVKERNEYMARKLAHIIHHYPDEKIIAVVGAGHEKEIATLLKSYLKQQKETNKKK
jgi:pheromone shutdown-related protein TraB